MNETEQAVTKAKELETWFQKYWRPALGWSVVISFLFALFLMHLINVSLQMLYWQPGNPTPQIDKPDTVLLLEAAALALGFGGFRMLEKFKNVAGGPGQ